MNPIAMFPVLLPLMLHRKMCFTDDIVIAVVELGVPGIFPEIKEKDCTLERSPRGTHTSPMLN